MDRFQNNSAVDCLDRFSTNDVWAPTLTLASSSILPEPRSASRLRGTALGLRLGPPSCGRIAAYAGWRSVMVNIAESLAAEVQVVIGDMRFPTTLSSAHCAQPRSTPSSSPAGLSRTTTSAQVAPRSTRGHVESISYRKNLLRNAGAFASSPCINGGRVGCC